MTSAHSPWVPSQLINTRTKNGSGAIAEIPSTLAGNTATMLAHLLGSGLSDNSQILPPKNGMGSYGHDHSGGVFGKPFYRSIARFNMDAFTSYNAEFSDGSAENKFAFDSKGANVTSSLTGPLLHFWVPPCDPVNGAYVNLGIVTSFKIRSTTLVTGDSIDFRYKVWTRGIASENAPQITTITKTVPTSAGFYLATSGSTQKLRVKPGAVNSVQLEMRVVRDATSGNRTAEVHWLEHEFGVYAT